MSNVSGNFFIHGNVEFNDRQKSIFATLDNIIPSNVKTSNYTEEDFRNSKHNVCVSSVKKELKHFRGQESIFKKPDAPKKHSFKVIVPDYIKNPHKWKKYELGDYVMTEKSNWEVAMKFHKDLQTRKEAMQVEDVVTEPVKFNLHITPDSSELAIKEDKKPEYKDGKVIMPEYVVGQKPKKISIKRKPTNKEEPTANIKLDHLSCDDPEYI